MADEDEVKEKLRKEDKFGKIDQISLSSGQFARSKTMATSNIRRVFLGFIVPFQGSGQNFIIG